MTTTSSPTQVTNTATSPSLPFTPSPVPQAPPPHIQSSSPPSLLQPPLIQHPQSLPLPPPPPPPLPPPQQHPQHQQPLVRTVTVQSCSHSQASQQYATYVPTTTESYGQNVYTHGTGQQTLIMTHPSQGQPPLHSASQEEPVFNQNPVYGNYTVPMQQQPVPQPGVSNIFILL